MCKLTTNSCLKNFRNYLPMLKQSLRAANSCALPTLWFRSLVQWSFECLVSFLPLPPFLHLLAGLRCSSWTACNACSGYFGTASTCDQIKVGELYTAPEYKHSPWTLQKVQTSIAIRSSSTKTMSSVRKCACCQFDWPTATGR